MFHTTPRLLPFRAEDQLAISTYINELASLINNQDRQLIAYDRNTHGAEFAIGYKFNDVWHANFGYCHLSDLSNSWVVSTLDTESTLNEIQAVMPKIGDGTFIGVTYRHSLAEKLYFDGLFEIQKWQQTTTTNIGQQAIEMRRSGIDPVYGIGLTYRVSSRATLGLNAKRYKYDADSATTPVISKLIYLSS